MSNELSIKRAINLVRCEGAICVSVDDYYDRYYAKYMTKHPIDIERYEVK